MSRNRRTGGVLQAEGFEEPFFQEGFVALTGDLLDDMASRAGRLIAMGWRHLQKIDDPAGHQLGIWPGEIKLFQGFVKREASLVS